MPIHVWGTDYRRSPASLRSQLFVPLEQRPETVREILALGFQDLVYLHTCNRVEFYTTARDHFADTSHLWARLFAYLGLPVQTFYQGFHFEGKSAVRHIARVASSLESMVIGEPQILGQLKKSLAWTQDHGLPLGRPLHRAFQFAFETAKAVRTQTSIGQNSVSVASLGIERLKHQLTEVPLEQAVLVGTSPICILVRNWLEKNAPGCPITWVNRTPQRLAQIPESKGTEILSLDAFIQNPLRFSHFFTATAASETLFDSSFLNKLNEGRRLLFDFAAPPDIETTCAVPPGVEIIPLENLAVEARENEDLRQVAVNEATSIIEKALREFYLEQKEAPLLRDFNEVAPQFEAALKDAVAELQKWVAQEQLQDLSKWARSLVLKNLHHSREHLRSILRRASQTSPETAPPL